MSLQQTLKLGDQKRGRWDIFLDAVNYVIQSLRLRRVPRSSLLLEYLRDVFGLEGVVNRVVEEIHVFALIRKRNQSSLLINLVATPIEQQIVPGIDSVTRLLKPKVLIF